MGMNYQLDRAWANAAKGVRQLQRADKALEKDDFQGAGSHFGKALDYFSLSVEHLAKAEDDADVKAGKLLDGGDQELQRAIEKYADGDVSSAAKHYEKALDKYDEALALIN